MATSNPEAYWNLLAEYVDQSLKALEKTEASHAEAFFTYTKTIEASIRNSEILTQKQVNDSGVGFRAVVDGCRVGFACTNNLNQTAIKETGREALSIAKASPETPHFALPEATQLPRVEGIFDSEVAGSRVEEAVDLARRAIEAAEGFDKRVIAKDGLVRLESGWRGVVNALGVNHKAKETHAVVYLGAGGEHEGEVTSSCFDIAFSRLSNLEPEIVGENAARMVVEAFNPKSVKSFQGPAIFGPEAVSNQLFTVLMDALKGEHAATGASPWTKKTGQLVASEHVTITDDALRPNGFSSRAFDDEGSGSQKTVLVRKGELRSFLHSTTTAKALNTEGTSNASRFHGGLDLVQSIIGNGYRTRPEAYASNLVIKPGNQTQEELVSNIKRGVLVESMAGFPQAGSGVISAQLSRAFLIRNGEKQYPIKGGMVSGVAFDWLRQISGVGQSIQQYRNSIVPALQVEDVSVIGA